MTVCSSTESLALFFFLLVSLVLVNLLPPSLMNRCFSFHGLMGYIFILINSGNVLSLKSDASTAKLLQLSLARFCPGQMALLFKESLLFRG